MTWRNKLEPKRSCVILRRLLTGVDFADMDDNTEQVVCAGSAQLVRILSFRSSASARIWQHVELQWEVDNRINL